MARFKETGLYIHLKNAGKYTLVILTSVAYIFISEEDESVIGTCVYMGLASVTVIISYFWDLYMDWGLLRTGEPGKQMLRNKLMYPVWFYYYAAVSNFAMRMTWLFVIYHKTFDQLLH